MTIRRSVASLALFAAAVFAVGAEKTDDVLAPWREGVTVRPVSPDSACHTIHSYFNTCPESPDGKFVLFFASLARDGQRGDVRVRNRATGEEKTLARDVHVEDAHRVACQQWVSNGKRVVYHGERDGEWYVTVVDVETATARDLAKGRLAGWGQPNADLVPLYGPHWNPGAHRDLELVNVESGEIRTALAVDAVKKAYPEWYQKSFGEKPASIFFPILSPDLKRVFFKMAAAEGGEVRTKEASVRQGLVCYSLDQERFLYMNPRWGHPSWERDSKTIVETSFHLFDSDNGKEQQLPGLPNPRGDHPSASPDGKLIVTDTTMDVLVGDAKDWAVIVADARGTNYVVIHKFDNSHGAASWRRSHPHPVFSADGRRIYFNVNSGIWTQLHVAELPAPK